MVPVPVFAGIGDNEGMSPSDGGVFLFYFFAGFQLSSSRKKGESYRPNIPFFWSFFSNVLL
jgi:hypothetical protein